MDLLGVHTVGGEELGEDGLGVGQVVMAGGPVTGVLQVGAVTTGGVAGEVLAPGLSTSMTSIVPRSCSTSSIKP